MLGSGSELCLPLPEEFRGREKEGIASWRNGRHKVVGKERTNGFGVECEWDSFPGPADLGPVETGKGS